MSTRMLLCTDGSEASRITADLCTRFARAFSAEILLAHVLELQRLEHKMIPDFQLEMIRQRAKDAAEAVLAKELKLLQGQGLKIQPRLLVGAAGPAICTAADEEQAALVVLGRRGHGDIQDILFGSVSSHVVHHCDKPVLVVKPTGSEIPVEPDGRLLRLLVGVDGSEASLRCLDHLSRLTGATERVALTLLNVVNPFRPGFEHLPNESRYEALAKIHREATELLEEAAARLRALGFKVDTRVEEGVAGNVLCAVSHEDDYDLVVVGRVGMTEVAEVLFGSVCHHVLHHCPSHVLVVP